MIFLYNRTEIDGSIFNLAYYPKDKSWTYYWKDSEDSPWKLSHDSLSQEEVKSIFDLTDQDLTWIILKFGT